MGQGARYTGTTAEDAHGIACDQKLIHMPLCTTSRTIQVQVIWEHSSPSLRGSDNWSTSVPTCLQVNRKRARRTVEQAYRMRSPPGVTGVMYAKTPQASPSILDGAGLQNAACKAHASPLPSFLGIYRSETMRIHPSWSCPFPR